MSDANILWIKQISINPLCARKAQDSGPFPVQGLAHFSPEILDGFGLKGIPIGAFCKDFNEKTKDLKEGIPLPIKINVKTNPCLKALVSAGLTVEGVCRGNVGCGCVHLASLDSTSDRTYDLKIGQPTVSYFLKQAAGIEKGAGKTGHEIAGMVTVRAVFEIARVKSQDDSFKLRDTSMQNVVKSIIGSARSLGIRVVNE
ncbi:39S ribosomal protein L11, mitochondrial [Labeo rohita]|uniref:Large ribosomal subunit protein uL11 n=1 Tax=Labeo rohita TaxID=84645 RepID=A0ABQ8M1L0_LABRO|nr:39S ribosomal protein L11, mitochondrial [Labeo rohita]